MGNLIKRDRIKFGEAFQKDDQGSFVVKQFTMVTNISYKCKIECHIRLGWKGLPMTYTLTYWSNQ